MAKTEFVPIIVILIFLCVNQLVTANLREDLEDSHAITGLIPRKVDVDRQGLIGSSLFGGPLAVAAFLFSLPTLLPSLLMAPLAIAGLTPAIGAVENFMSSIGGGGSSGLGGIASLLTPPSAGAAEAASQTVSSTASTGSSTGSGSKSPFVAALRSISELLFNRRRFSYHSPLKSPQSQQKPQNSAQSDTSSSKPGQSGGSPQNRFGTLMTSLKEVYGILKTGLRRYEITESDCQSRIICEVHQKAIGRSSTLGSITASILDFIGVESHLDRSNAFSERAKFVIKDFVRAAKTGLSNNDCALVFNRCPSNVPSEPPVNQISNDYFLKKPHIHELSQLLHTKIVTNKPQRPAIKSSIVTTPRTVNYYSNINKL